MVAAAVGISAAVGLAGSAMTSSAASSGAKSQADAANKAAQLQQHQQEVTRADLMPYNILGQQSLDRLNSQYGQTQTDLGNAFNNVQGAIPGRMTQEELQKTPGYQFQLAEGLKAVANSNAAKGLGISGNAMKGFAKFATGLADSNYQNQFNNQQTIFGDQSQQFSNAYNKAKILYDQAYGPAALGENAAAITGIQGTASANNAGTNIAGAGQAIGAGQVASANSLASGFNGAAGLNMFNALNSAPTSTAKANGDAYGATANGYAPIIGSNGMAGGGV